MSNDRQSTGHDPAAEPARGRTLRFGLRSKITLPYVILAALISLAGAYIVTRFVVDSLQDRFANQLVESGRLVADGVVSIEEQSLATLRAIAQTEGVAGALLLENADALHRLVYPIAVNQHAEYVEVIGAQGRAVLSLHHLQGGGLDDYDVNQGSEVPGDWAVVQRVLAGELDELGDKYADLVLVPWGHVLYITGPVKQDGDVVGVVAIGRSLDGVVAELQQASAGHVSLFGSDGQVLASTLYVAGEERPITPAFWQQVIDEQEVAVYPRDVVAREREYTEVFGPLEARGRADLAVFSAALARGFIVQATPITQVQLVILIALVLLFVISIGTVIARRITRPLLSIVRASNAVASGDLDQRVEVRTGDEVGILAESFNEMVRGLQRGQFVREAFGRAVSPEVVQELLDGGLELGGETRQVTVLFSDIRGFTTLSESLSPQDVVKWLNEYLGMMNGAVRAHGGVVNKFVGDAIVAIFGAPQPLPDSAQCAVRAAFEMKQRLAELNRTRAARGEIELRNGVGVGTGSVVAGIVGSEERWEYTVIGDVVNVASRLDSLTKQYPDYDLLATAETVNAMTDVAAFSVDDLGDIQVKGRTKPVRVFGLRRSQR
jgi:adenylate cyclase